MGGMLRCYNRQEQVSFQFLACSSVCRPFCFVFLREEALSVHYITILSMQASTLILLGISSHHVGRTHTFLLGPSSLAQNGTRGSAHSWISHGS